MPAVYHAIVRHRLRTAFTDVAAGRFDAVVDRFAAVHHHEMVGEHALGGRRVGRASTRAWYERLGRLLPGLHFELGPIVVAGGPWRTIATVSWTDRFELPDGGSGTNQGVHEFELVWGRVTSMVVHCDTARLQAYLARIAAAGVADAKAAPIDDSPA